MTAQGTFSDYRIEIWLNQLSKVWLGLAFDDPNIAGAYASEVFGRSYSRVNVAFSEVESRVIFNENDITWTGMPATRVTHVVGWNAQYNGDMEFSVPLPKAQAVLAGGKFQLPSAILAISLP